MVKNGFLQDESVAAESSGRRRLFVLAATILVGLVAPAFAAPAISVNSAPIAFSPPSFMVARSSPETLRRITNTGTDPLTITVVLRGTNPGDFTLGGCTQVVLPPGWLL